MGDRSGSLFSKQLHLSPDPPSLDGILEVRELAWPIEKRCGGGEAGYRLAKKVGFRGPASPGLADKVERFGGRAGPRSVEKNE